MKTNKTRYFGIALISFILTACGGGGGGDSSTGGGSGDVVFIGTQTVTFSSPGIPPSTSTFGITIIISGNTVTVTDGDIQGSASLSADGMNFIVPVDTSFSDDDITCTGEAIYTGSIAGDTASGSIAGTSPCTSQGISVTITERGNFSASSAPARAPVNSATFRDHILSTLN